jgi:hypothetical protein
MKNGCLLYLTPKNFQTEIIPIVLPIQSMMNIYIVLGLIPITIGSTTPIPTSRGDSLTNDIISSTTEIPSGLSEDRIVYPVTEYTTTESAETGSMTISNDNPTGAVRCSVQEAMVWKDNNEFSLALSRIARSLFGNGPSTATNLRTEYKALSPECASCFGDNVACGAAKCWMHCTWSSFSEACLDCTDRECNPALKICLGVEDEDMPPRPSVEAELLTTSSTTAPRKRPVRRPVADSTTSEPAEERTTINMDVSVGQNATAPNSMDATTSSNPIHQTFSDSFMRYWYVYISGLVGLLALVMSRLNGTGTSF